MTEGSALTPPHVAPTKPILSTIVQIFRAVHCIWGSAGRRRTLGSHEDQGGEEQIHLDAADLQAALGGAEFPLSSLGNTLTDLPPPGRFPLDRRERDGDATS